MRRFFIGLIAGGIVAAFGLGIVSQVAAVPEAQTVDAVADAVPATNTGGVANTGAVPTVAAGAPPAGDLATPVPATPPDAAPTTTEADDPAPTLAADTAPPSTPRPLYNVYGAGLQAEVLAPVTDETAVGAQGTDATDMVVAGVAGQAEIIPARPLEQAPAVEVQDAAPDPALPPQPQVAVLPAPEAVIDDVDALQENATALPAVPPVVPLIDLPQPQLAASVADGASAPAADSTASLGQTGPEVPQAPGPDVAPSLAELPPPPPPEEQAVLAPEAVPADALPPASVVATQEPVSPSPDRPVVPSPEAVIVAPALPELAEAAPAAVEVDAAPSLLQPDAPLIEPAPELPVTPSLGSSAEGVIVNRPKPPGAAVDSPILPEVALETPPPVTRFAAAFDNPDAKPLFSIVLIDTGEATLDRAAIASLPFAVSVAIDPLSPDAASHAALYRAGGKEVLMLASGIPEGASPADLEQTFQALDAALPEAVAVVDTEAASFQNNRPLATQIVPILAAQGRGLLTWDKGLNAADQVARREGLASAMIFRRIDGAGEGVPVIRRYLDRAAFKAAQEGQVTVIGEARPQTVAALLEWAIEGRASSVAIAPISAQLALR